MKMNLNGTKYFFSNTEQSNQVKYTKHLLRKAYNFIQVSVSGLITAEQFCIAIYIFNTKSIHNVEADEDNYTHCFLLMSYHQ